MPEVELVLVFVRPLNRAGIRYIVSGSVAAILYGEPRLTHDVDFIVFLRNEDIGRLREIFPSSAFYVPPQDVLLDEVQREQRGHFNFVHVDSGYKADFYTAGRDEMHAWAFREARRLQYAGEPIVVAPPEYVIVRKLEYFREGGSEKHLRDIRSILKMSKDQIDVTVLEERIRSRGLQTEWDKARA